MVCGGVMPKELALGLKFNLIKIIKSQNQNIKIEKIRQEEINKFNLNLKMIKF